MNENNEVVIKVARITAISSLFSSLVAGVIVGCFSLFAIKVQNAENQTAQVQQARWELKRASCLKALSVVDAVFANQSSAGHVSGIEAGKVKPVQIDVQEARQVMNELSVCCDNPDVPRLFLELITAGQSEQKSGITMDRIIDFRNAIRKELNFGKNMDFNRNTAWIGKLPDGDK